MTDFASVAKGQGLPLDYDLEAHLMELLNARPKKLATIWTKIAKLLGQHGP